MRRITQTKNQGRETFYSHGRQASYDKEKSEKKPLLKTDVLGQSARNDSATHFTLMMDNNGNMRDGALPVESPRAGRVPGPMPQRGPTQTTGGHPVPLRGARLRRRRVNATGQERTANTQETPRPLNILQWNAEAVYNKSFISLKDCIPTILMYPRDAPVPKPSVHH